MGEQEDKTMKSRLDTTALSGLFLDLALTTGPGTVLAANGSDRLGEYHLRNQQLLQMREDSSESFTSMVEREPTAAGYPSEDIGPDVRQPPKYQSLIHQQKVEFGK
ncbi:hypothetical protein FQZ97_1047140 [compost metagenome]